MIADLLFGLVVVFGLVAVVLTVLGVVGWLLDRPRVVDRETRKSLDALGRIGKDQ